VTDQPVDARITWWAKKFDDIDLEIARLAMACNVRILEAGAIERVLRNDASVCGSRNPRAFDKLRKLLMMHYAVREGAVDVLGDAKTRLLVEKIVTALRERIGPKPVAPAVDVSTPSS
jgi:hypothetical protein